MIPFDPITTAWFQRRFGTPTDVQSRAWPVVAAGNHVLVTAPTGTGKTLAAFLGALDKLLTTTWPTGQLRVLYISPLKALNNDVQRNLLFPLAELRREFEAANRTAPTIDVMVRSGDTAEDERRRLRRHPPEILITTPESLNILLTQANAATLFGGLQLVILDEIHAIVGSKRGTALLTALERLVLWAGEYQRLGLSATVNPPGLVAQVLGGFLSPGVPRPVQLIASPATKQYEVQVVLPKAEAVEEEEGKLFWESLALELRQRTQQKDSTLIFANSRRACEKLARLMNDSVPNSDELVAYSHHGSLSKDIRREVELKLKDGQLKALVATNSLELGIDIGDLDEVVLAEAPRTAASAIQKVGRAGHRTGEVSRARLYPSHGLDLVQAAVVLRCIREQTVEPIVVPEGPLDVLAQTLLSAWSARPSTDDEMFELLRRSWPYRSLRREAFDLVVEMLAGRYANTRIPELKPRVERSSGGLWSSKTSVPFLLYSSGGTIPDRGYFTMRDHRTGAALGELDEEFVWERTLGDRFALGAQVWKIAAVDDQAVRVEPVQAPPHIIPFWKAEDQDRSWFLSEKIGTFLEAADRALNSDPGPWTAELVSEGFSPEAAARLVSVLERERAVVGALPHRWRLVVERVEGENPLAADRIDADQYVLHTFWGARLNRPWAFALAQAWEDRFGYALETYPGDDQILLLVPPETNVDEVLSLVTPDNLEDLLKRRLEATGFFGARFREGAGRALLLPKPGFAKRTPLWQTRLRSKRLFDAVAGLPDFPILLEAWRQCLHDEFELDALRARLDERATGRIATWECRTNKPSPFTEGLLWRQVNEKMYQDDTPGARRPSSLEPQLWSELFGDRPKIARENIADWEARWGRTAPGYAPETPADLADFLEVRIALSIDEWRRLIDACVRDSGRSREEWETVAVIEDGRVGTAAMVPLWSQPQLLLVRWLEGRGPVPLSDITAFWRLETAALESWRGEHEPELAVGLLTEGAETPEVCLVRTWEQLVRRGRNQRRSQAPSRPAAGLPLFAARRHGLVHPERQAGNTEAVVSPLLGLPVAADLWEGAILPSRLMPYRSADFDQLFIEGGLRWFGVGPERVVLGFPEDCEAFLPTESVDASWVFGSLPPGSEISVPDLATRSGLTLGPLTEALWQLAWKGVTSATTFGPLRQGLKTGFRFESSSNAVRPSRAGFQRWSSARTTGGVWRLWERSAIPLSSLDNLEDSKRRARLILDRHGIVFRALLAHEGPAFQWKQLFPALRLMELSGELVGGMFWSNVPGLQFATPQALRELEAGGDEEALWVQHAQDPTSLCGLGLEALSSLPRRTAGTWLCWKGSQLVAVVSSAGKRIEPRTELSAEDWRFLVDRLAPIFHANKTNWTIETIGDRDAADHSLAILFRQSGFQAHGDKLILWKH